MALATTTLAAACTATDTSVLLTSAASVAAGRYMLVDEEFMRVDQSYSSGTTVPVLRGRNGSANKAHVITANVTHGAAADFPNPIEQTEVTYPNVLTRTLTSYTTSGAITLPTGSSIVIAVLNGTSVLTMTLANPTKEMDGAILIVVGNGAAAHTLTYSAGLGNAGGNYDVLTWNGTGTASVALIAINGFWTALHTITGTLTNIGAAIA